MIINPILSRVHRVPCLGSGMQDYVLLYALVRAFQAERILEIGTHQGASAIAMCQAVHDNKCTPQMWTLDSWVQRDVREAAEANIDDVGFADNVTMVDGDSKVTAPVVLKTNGPMDLVFIDGCHFYDGVLADYQNCQDHTNVMLFHDSARPNIQRVLEVARRDGWTVTMFPTVHVEGDGHTVGLALAVRPKDV